MYIYIYMYVLQGYGRTRIWGYARVLGFRVGNKWLYELVNISLIQGPSHPNNGESNEKENGT